MDLDGLKLLLSSTSAELAELELKRYHWWLRYYEEWHGEVPRADQNSANSAAVALLRSACSAVAGESWRHLWGSWIRCSDMPTGDPTDHFLLFYGTRTMGFIWTSHQVQKYGPRSVMFSGRPVLHGLCPWWESCAEGAIRVRSLSENWQNVDRVTVMRGYKWEMIWEIDLKSQRLRSQIFSDLLSVTVFFLRLDLYFVHRFPQIAVGIFSIRWFRCVSAPRLRCIVELLQSCDSISHGIGLSFTKLVAVQNAKKAEGNGHTMVREVSPDKTQRPKDPKTRRPLSCILSRKLASASWSPSCFSKGLGGAGSNRMKLHTSLSSPPGWFTSSLTVAPSPLRTADFHCFH